MPPPGFDQHLGLSEAVEDLAIDERQLLELVAKARSILSRAIQVDR